MLLSVLAFVAIGCGGGSKGSTSDTTAKPSGAKPPTTEALGAPVRGGSITVGLEAETNSWLPGSANFSNSGINVALSIYDPKNFVFVASKQQPLLYGIVCVILALGTGWLAGVVFRR